MPDKNDEIVGEFILDQGGNFKIHLTLPDSEARKDHWIESRWVPYQGVAVIHHEGTIYAGVSAYYEGFLPIEQVFKIEPIKSSKSEPQARSKNG